ncbi:DUF4625 domain-containing protein [Niabella beijingensis]|uniref:DUF4625 domain-containing protein n=1 Tax=Niabella beijingensis TaxID=2872700 RepID=UPI001CBB142C|nr:DUF4625 domain-containing protein [Niabella beijingensis]MBZ4192475.1 DUF4625 domain-containing protein [Niabella beijingensis]
MVFQQPFSKWAIAIIVLLAGVASCKKDDKELIAKPTITNLEIGANNSKTGYPGADIHIEGDITAPGTIENIAVEIRPESGNGWKFNETFTEGYTGTRNATLHEHIDIPEDAATGRYQVLIRIADKTGNVTELAAELNIVTDPSLPSIKDLEVAYEGNGELHVEGAVTAVNKIAAITIEVHGGSYEKEFPVTGDYAGKTTYHLHQHIDIADAPSGHYHVHVAVKDQAGKEMEFEGHFDK